MRGGYELAHQSQVLQRDLKAEEILRAPGEEAYGYVREYPDARSPYDVVVKAPNAPGLAWTAFHTVGDFKKFVAAYGLKIRGSTAPGQSFHLVMPRKPRFKKLRCAGPAKDW